MTTLTIQPTGTAAQNARYSVSVGRQDGRPSSVDTLTPKRLTSETIDKLTRTHNARAVKAVWYRAGERAFATFDEAMTFALDTFTERIEQMTTTYERDGGAWRVTGIETTGSCRGRFAAKQERRLMKDYGMKRGGMTGQDYESLSAEIEDRYTARAEAVAALGAPPMECPYLTMKAPEPVRPATVQPQQETPMTESIRVEDLDNIPAPGERAPMIERFGRSGWQWCDQTCREYRTNEHGKGLWLYDEDAEEWERLEDVRHFHLSDDVKLAVWRLANEGMGIRYATA